MQSLWPTKRFTRAITAAEQPGRVGVDPGPKAPRAPGAGAGRGRPAVLSLFAALALLAAACNPYPQSTFELRSDYAWDIQHLFNQILFWAAIVFVVVEAALVVAAVKFRGRPSDPLPRQTHGNARIEIAWTAAPAIVLAFIMVPTIQTIFKTQAPAPEGSLQVRVTAHQWWWEFEYPELGIRTANEVHMPLGRTVSFTMRSADVIHSFWIPAMGGKRDVNPSHDTRVWWTPEATGTYPGQCAEFCGDSHANMRLRGIVQTQAEFDAWVRQQKTPAATPPAGTDAATGAQLFQQRGCAACHTIAGTPAAGRTAPDLTHVASRSTIAGGLLENTPDNVRAWLHDPPGVKPGALMPNLNLSDAELKVLVAYLESLK